jgi:hypothetical protein
MTLLLRKFLCRYPMGVLYRQLRMYKCGILKDRYAQLKYMKSERDGT